MVLCMPICKIRQFTIRYAGLLGQWAKRIVNKASDVPSIIYFSSFIFSLQKSFLLGTSHTWSTIRLPHRPSEPVYYIVD
jgi:hypothetical protein